MNKKRAFTMVELIFVIVILGILAAVAVPRLNASREDAKRMKLKANLITLAKDLENYYVANGGFCTPDEKTGWCTAKIPEITNVRLDSVHPEGTGIYFKVGGQLCFYVWAEQSNLGYGDWRTYVYDYPRCLAEMRDPAYKDIRHFFTGYSEGDTTMSGAQFDAIDNPGKAAYHYYVDSNVQW